MIKITENFLSINEYSRGGKKIFPVKAIVLHWTGNVGASAKANRDFFESRKEGKLGYGSAHYIIDGDTIIYCIPVEEVAYHCGTSKIDPVSGKIYTDYAREKFGPCAIDTTHNSPNNCTIGLEMCPKNALGEFSDSVWNNTKELVIQLLDKYNLTVDDITTHNKIVGWKDCPKLFVDKPEEFERFKNEVSLLRAQNLNPTPSSSISQP